MQSTIHNLQPAIHNALLSPSTEIDTMRQSPTNHNENSCPRARGTVLPTGTRALSARTQLTADWTHRLERIPQTEHRPAIPKFCQRSLIRSESQWQTRGAIAERLAPCYYELPMSLATSHTLSMEART